MRDQQRDDEFDVVVGGSDNERRALVLLQHQERPSQLVSSARKVLQPLSSAAAQTQSSLTVEEKQRWIWEKDDAPRRER